MFTYVLDPLCIPYRPFSYLHALLFRRTCIPLYVAEGTYSDRTIFLTAQHDLHFLSYISVSLCGWWSGSWTCNTE